ncbi:MAG: hypothetical protein JO016_20165 [Actinobacteria bacterium]|nr:hypothetical protein [Actinomycetota bacterium]
MHPDYARADYALRQRPTLAQRRHEEHAVQARAAHRDQPHRSRRWKLNWTMLSPRDVVSDAPGSARQRRTWTIIISASRPN